MLSFSKIMLLALVIGAVWFGWRWFTRMNGGTGSRPVGHGSSPFARRGQGGGRPQPSAGRGGMAEDMEKCPDCGAYVAPSVANACGRAGCPYGR